MTFFCFYSLVPKERHDRKENDTAGKWSFQVKCASEDLGYPKATKVRWLQNGIEMGGEDSFILNVLKSTSSSQGNYSCAPYNIAGLAKADSVQVRLKAPPTFVQRLPFQKGYVFSYVIL